MNKKHYGWAVCAASTLLLFCTIGMASSAFGIFMPFIRSVNGFTNAQTNLLTTIRLIGGIVATLFVDKYIEKLGCRMAAVVALLLETIGFVIFGLAKSITVYYVGSVFVGFAFALGGMVLVTILINKWFRSSKSLAISICSAGSGIAAIIFPTIVTKIVENVSLEMAFFVEAAFIFVAAIICFLVLRNDPADMGKEPYFTGSAEAKAAKSFGTRVSTPVFILMLVMLYMNGFCANLDTASVALLYTTEGFDSMTVSLLASTMGFCLIVGKLIYGAFTDKFGGLKSHMVFALCVLVATILGALASLKSVPLAMASIILVGIGGPLFTVGVSVLAGDFSDEKHFASDVKLLQLFAVLGGATSGIVPGLIADKTGSYTQSMWIGAALWAIYYVVIMIIYKKHKKA